MDLVRGFCFLCKREEQILKTKELKPFIKYIIHTYFEKKTAEARELKNSISSSSNGLCIVCACNIETSFKFKKTYENKIRRETTVRKTLNCCFMCGFKGFGLVKTESNPNQFEENIDLFMKTILKPRFYKQCAVCFVCVLELQNYNKIYSSLEKEVELIKGNVDNTSPSKSVRIATSTPLKTNVLRKRKRAGKDLSLINETPQAKIRKITAFDLSNHQPLKRLRNSRKLKLPWSSIENDKKFFSCVPYVPIEKSQVIQKPVEIEKEVDKSEGTTEIPTVENEPIEIKDVDLDENKIKSPKPKVEIKIKLAAKRKKPCPKSKQKVSPLCDICGNIFSSSVELKAHVLWHEKPLHLQVKLKREELLKKDEDKMDVEQKDEEIMDISNKVTQDEDEKDDSDKNEDDTGKTTEIEIEGDKDDKEDNKEDDNKEGKKISEDVEGAEKDVERVDDKQEKNEDENRIEIIDDDDDVQPEMSNNDKNDEEYVVLDEVKDGDEEKAEEIHEIISDDEKESDKNDDKNKEKCDDVLSIDSNSDNRDETENIKLSVNSEENESREEKQADDSQTEKGEKEDETSTNVKENKENCNSDEEIVNNSEEDTPVKVNGKEKEIETDEDLVLGVTLEDRLQEILGDNDDEDNLVSKKNDDEEKIDDDDKKWDEICKEKDILNGSLSTILKKNWTKSSEESPKSKKVRFSLEQEQKVSNESTDSNSLEEVIPLE